MSFKYIFIGLPGAGKTTALKSLIGALYPDMPVLSIDDEVKKRLNATLALDSARSLLSNFSLEDNLINEICRKWCDRYKKEDVLDALMRKGYPKHSATTMKILGEPAWRELEAAIAADLMSSRPDAAFDLGAKQPLHPLVKEQCIRLGFKLILLDADEGTILEHLSTIQEDDCPRWQKISNYNAAGEDGWKTLARRHREERLASYHNIADIIINVSNKSIQAVTASIQSMISNDGVNCIAARAPLENSSELSLQALIFSKNMTTAPNVKKSTTPDVGETQCIPQKKSLGIRKP